MRRQIMGLPNGLLAVLGLVAIVWAVVPDAPTTDAGVRVIGTDGDTGFSGRVTRIVDGDTLWISGQSVRIRIWGLDAPETREQAGAAATAALDRLAAGKTLRCVQRDIDRYGRIVGQCWLPDGRDIAAAMIASGTATEYCRFSDNHYGTC